MTTDSAPRLGPDDRPPLLIRYRNHRGEVTERRVRPSALWYGKTTWHPEPQWLLDAYDLDRQADRTFAMRDILRWGEPRPGEAGEPVDECWWPDPQLTPVPRRAGSAMTDDGPDAEDVALVKAYGTAEFGWGTVLRNDPPRKGEWERRHDVALAARDALLARIIRYRVALKVAHRALAAMPGGPREGAREGASDGR